MIQFRFPILLKLASRDLYHGWQSTACLTLAVAVALVPLLLLYGLKFGVVTNLIDTLREDPRIREIKLVRDQPLDAGWFEELGRDPRVDFLLPKARHLAASMRIRGPESRRALDARMIPTLNGDPLLTTSTVPLGLDQTVLTARAAIETGAKVGDPVTFEVLRIVDGKSETRRLDMLVVGILARDILQTDDAFVTPAFESAVEHWREGFAVPELELKGVRADDATDAAERTFASFRLFARDIRDVPGLRDRLLEQGLNVETRAAEIETALEIETGLGWVFFAVSALSVAGFLMTLGLHLAASVVEKARELAVLRLLGLRNTEISVMPSMQGIMIAGAGALVACAITGTVEPIVNSSLDGLAGLTGDISRLNALHYLFAFIGAVAAGGIAGSAAGYRAATLELTQGLRRD